MTRGSTRKAEIAQFLLTNSSVKNGNAMQQRGNAVGCRQVK